MKHKTSDNLKQTPIIASMISLFVAASFLLSWPAVICILLTIGLTITKIMGILAVSWWIVTAPIWLPLLLIILVIFLIVAFILFLS